VRNAHVVLCSSTVSQLKGNNPKQLMAKEHSISESANISRYHN